MRKQESAKNEIVIALMIMKERNRRSRTRHNTMHNKKRGEKEKEEKEEGYQRNRAEYLGYIVYTT